MSSDFIIQTSEVFDKSASRLFKKYRSLKSDLLELKAVLLNDPRTGIPLGRNCYKVRMKIASKQTGKSGGARVITYVKIEAKQITLLDIYDKSERDTISDKELDNLLELAPE